MRSTLLLGVAALCAISVAGCGSGTPVTSNPVSSTTVTTESVAATPPPVIVTASPPVQTTTETTTTVTTPPTMASGAMSSGVLANAAPVAPALTPPPSLDAPFLDVSYSPVTPMIAQGDGLGTPRGVLVTGIGASGAAARAGIAQGDVILSYNNRAIYTPADLGAADAASVPGSVVPVMLWRAGTEIALSVQI